MINDFEGTFVFSARCGNAQALINSIEAQITWQQRQWSVQLIKQEKPTMAPEQSETSAELQFDQTPPQHKLPEVFISYSWREDAKQTVEQFCLLAADKNVHIVQDINALKTGDSISAFMRRIGRGKRIIVVLSKAYLESPNCMFELYEIWRTSANEPQVFRERVKAFALEDAKIYTLPDRLKYATYWKKQFDAIKAVLDEHGATILGEKGYADFERIQQFYLNVNSMLSAIADILAPKDIEALLAYGLDGLELD
jgi:internalin A